MPHDEELGALIQRADLNQRLTRALEIKGHKSPIRTLVPQVAPVVIVEDLTKQAEWVTPTERKLASAVEIAAGGAGTNGILCITNPVGSGVIGLVERVAGNGLTGAIRFAFGLVNVAPVTPANLFFRDRRVTGAPTLRAFSGVDAVLQIVNPYLMYWGSNAITCPWYDTEGVVIQPGESFGIQSISAGNLGITVNMWVQEIPL